MDIDHPHHRRWSIEDKLRTLIFKGQCCHLFAVFILIPTNQIYLQSAVRPRFDFWMRFPLVSLRQPLISVQFSSVQREKKQLAETCLQSLARVIIVARFCVSAWLGLIIVQRHPWKMWHQKKIQNPTVCFLESCYHNETNRCHGSLRWTNKEKNVKIIIGKQCLPWIESQYSGTNRCWDAKSLSWMSAEWVQANYWMLSSKKDSGVSNALQVHIFTLLLCANVILLCSCWGWSVRADCWLFSCNRNTICTWSVT